MPTTAKYSLFLWGAFGGVLPTIAKLASAYATIPATPLPELGLYFGLLLWAIVGGGVALTNTTAEVRGAIFAGIAAPAIIAGLVTGASDKNVAMLDIAAFAQDAGWTVRGGANTLVVNPSVTGGLPWSADIPVTAEVKNQAGDLLTVPVGTIKDWQAPTTFVIPEGAVNVYVAKKPVPLEFNAGGTSEVDLAVKTAPSLGGDFLWVLGGQRKFRIEDLDLAAVPPKAGEETDAVGAPAPQF